MTKTLTALAAAATFAVVPAPVYMAPPPAACIDQQWVWSPRRGEYVLRNVRVPC
mgnify:CR=1 FL=1